MFQISAKSVCVCELEQLLSSVQKEEIFFESLVACIFEMVEEFLFKMGMSFFCQYNILMMLPVPHFLGLHDTPPCVLIKRKLSPTPEDILMDIESLIQYVHLLSD